MLRPYPAAATAAEPKRSRWLLATLGALLILLVSAAPSMAATAHKYVGSLGAYGSGPGDWGGPQGIDWLASNGNLLVADQGNSRIQIVNSAGEQVAEWPNLFSGPYDVAVDETNNRVYVSEQWGAAIDIFDLSGTNLGQLDAGTWSGGVAGVAVDTSNGDVYAADPGAGVVRVYDSTGAAIGTFGSFSGPSAVAVDPTSHDVYVSDNGGTRVQHFTAQGATLVGELAGLAGTVQPLALATDPSNGDVYVGEGLPSGQQQIARYDASGTRQEAFGSDRLQGIGGIAVTATHRVYVTTTSWSTWPPDINIKVYGVTTIPDVTTDAATGVTSTDATLNGTINPLGMTVWYSQFDYGTDTNYGQGAWPMSTPSGTSTADPVSAAVSGLQPNMTYHYRLGAYGPFGSSYGSDQTFTTDPAAPTVGASHGDPVTTTAATIHTFVNANNSATTYHVEYGDTTAYGTSTAPASAGSGYGDQDVTADLTGLTPGTIYHYRVVANNGTGGDIAGPDNTVETAPADVPTADVSAVSATVSGVADVRGSGTYHFEYGTDTSYGSQTADAPAAAQSGDQTVTADIDGLQPGTTYHVRLVYTTAGGDRTVSDDGTFTTLQAPVVTTGDATNVSSSSATLNGTVDTHGLAGTFRFRVTGVNSTVVRETPEQNVTSDGAAAVSAAISDLPDNQEYEVVLEATVSGATTTGDATTFKTAVAPVVTPRTPEPAGNPYGCAAPHLADAKLPAVAGAAYTLNGSDLGVGGEVTVNGAKAAVDGWSAGAVTFIVPDDAVGKITVLVNCGNASNAVTITVAAPPSNAVTLLSASAKRGSTTAKVRVRVAGAGLITISGGSIRKAHKVTRKGGTYTVTVKLTSKASRALRRSKSGSLTAALNVAFTPTGGTAGTDSGDVTFRRKAKHHSHH